MGGSKGEIKVLHKTLGGFNEILSENCGILGGSVDCVSCVYSANTKYFSHNSVSDTREFVSGSREPSTEEKTTSRSGVMSLIRGSRSTLSVTASSPHRLGEGNFKYLFYFCRIFRIFISFL